MWDLSIPHILAIVATGLATFATYSQARHAIRRAEVEREKSGLEGRECETRAERTRDEGGRLVIPRHWMWAIVEALFRRSARSGAAFDARHARNVAALWLVIGTGSLFAMAAEVWDASPW